MQLETKSAMNRDFVLLLAPHPKTAGPRRSFQSDLMESGAICQLKVGLLQPERWTSEKCANQKEFHV